MSLRYKATCYMNGEFGCQSLQRRLSVPRRFQTDCGVHLASFVTGSAVLYSGV